MSLFVNIKDAFSQTRYPGELSFAVEGIGINEGWTVTYSSQSFPRWFDDNRKKYITDEYSSGSISGSGNTYGYQGFDSPDDVGPGVPIGYGEYRFKYKFANHSNTPTVIIDLYDANWSTLGYPGSHDIYIKWNNSNQKFYYKNECTNYYYERLGNGSSGQYFQIWELFNREANQQPFQLPPPSDFMCLNPKDYGEHPEFYWKEFDGSPGFQIRYKIYRIINHGNFFCVASSLESGFWTDKEVTLGASEDRFTYYVTAYTENSPESSPSRWVYIYGGLCKPFAGADSYIYSTPEQKNTNSTGLNLCPNPANPSTNIIYSITEPTPVQLAIFNIAGQQIARLVDEYQHEGEYLVKFNGQSLAGGIYLVRLLTKDQQVTQKILLLK